jgi:hypothetical protein
MLAFLWAFLYTLLEDIFPHSFGIGNGDTGKGNLFYVLLYFSFTTITSVGFGDITPITHQARSLVIIEQLIGVFFVAVLIARLLGCTHRAPNDHSRRRILAVQPHIDVHPTVQFPITPARARAGINRPRRRSRGLPENRRSRGRACSRPPIGRRN